MIFQRANPKEGERKKHNDFLRILIRGCGKGGPSYKRKG